MKLMVTGGAGFIGSEFVRQAIGLGYDVAVIDCLTYAGDMQRLKSHEKDVRFFQGDVSDKDFVFKTFTEFKPDKIVHWAAETHVDRSILNASPFMQTNVIGTHVMLEAAKKFGVHRFVNIATDEVYGELGDNGQFFEDTPLAPNSPYSVSKTSADMLGRAFFRTYGLPVITVRPSNNYGPWQYPEKLVPVVILKALHDKPVPVYSKGENIREWLYVSDCAGAVMNILQKGTIGEIYNVGSGQEKRNIDVVKKILQLVGKPESLIEHKQN
jgi:dTDP-glucose 4,6-dehydratase